MAELWGYQWVKLDFWHIRNGGVLFRSSEEGFIFIDCVVRLNTSHHFWFEVGVSVFHVSPL